MNTIRKPTLRVYPPKVSQEIFGGFLFSAVELLMNVSQLFVGYVRVNLRRGNIGVAKHHLDRTNIGAV